MSSVGTTKRYEVVVMAEERAWWRQTDIIEASSPEEARQLAADSERYWQRFGESDWSADAITVCEEGAEGYDLTDRCCEELGRYDRERKALPDLVAALRKADAYLRDPSTASATVGSRSDVLVEIDSALAKLDAEGGAA